MKKYDRKPMRFKNYDYSQAGLFFITICTKNRENLFGNIKNGKMIFNAFGNIAHDYWENIPNKYNNVDTGEFIIMPNHLHGILRLNNTISPVGPQFNASTNKQGIASTNNPNNASTNKPDNQFCSKNENVCKSKQGGTNKPDAINRTPTRMVGIGTVIRSFKAGCTHAINKINKNSGVSVWQRNYYDHIIRNENEYIRISKYIKLNPKNW